MQDETDGELSNIIIQHANKPDETEMALGIIVLLQGIALQLLCNGIAIFPGLFPLTHIGDGG